MFIVFFSNLTLRFKRADAKLNARYRNYSNYHKLNETYCFQQNMIEASFT